MFTIPLPPSCSDAGVFVEAGFGGTTGEDDPTPIPSPMLIFPPPEFDEPEELELVSSACLLLLFRLLFAELGNPRNPFIAFNPGRCLWLIIGLKPVPAPILFINRDCWFSNPGFIIPGLPAGGLGLPGEELGAGASGL